MALRASERARHSGRATSVLDRVRSAIVALGPDGRTDSWRGFLSQVILLTPPALLYFLVRDLVSGQEAEAFSNAASIVNFQQSLGLDWEASLQQSILDSEWVLTLVNWIYIYGHFPLVVGALFVLFRLSRRNFVVLRNAIVVSGAIGLICFAIFPVAPPRLFDPDLFFDSLAELSSSYQVLQNPDITNQFAAVPSFHVGWNVLVAVAIWRASPSRSLKLLALVFPMLMVTAVILTANHWVIDIVAGLAVALIGIGAAILFERLVAPRLVPDEPSSKAVSGAQRNEPSDALMETEDEWRQWTIGAAGVDREIHDVNV